MKATSTEERDWTPRERAVAAAIRADGNEIECCVKNGKRVFKVIATEDGKRPTLRTNGGGGIKIGADACTIRLTGEPRK